MQVTNIQRTRSIGAILLLILPLVYLLQLIPHAHHEIDVAGVHGVRAFHMDYGHHPATATTDTAEHEGHDHHHELDQHLDLHYARTLAARLSIDIDLSIPVSSHSVPLTLGPSSHRAIAQATTLPPCVPLAISAPRGPPRAA